MKCPEQADQWRQRADEWGRGWGWGEREEVEAKEYGALPGQRPGSKRDYSGHTAV